MADSSGLEYLWLSQKLNKSSISTKNTNSFGVCNFEPVSVSLT